MLNKISQHSRPLLSAAVIAVVLAVIVTTSNTSPINSFFSNKAGQASFDTVRESLQNIKREVSMQRKATFSVATIQSDTDSIIDYVALGLPQAEADTAQENIDISFTPFELEPVTTNKSTLE